MTATSPSTLAIGWPARAALRLYPHKWRAEYEDEMVGTLLEMVDAERSSSAPAAEVAHLALRGAVLRAKSSITFWGGLLIMVLLVFFAAQQPSGLVVERYWTTILATAGVGLPAALPVAALLGAWQGHRTARTGAALPSASRRMLQLLTHGAPVLGFVALGYIIAGLAELTASGMPPTWNADLRIPAAYLLMSAGAIAFGHLLGQLVPAGIAMPIGFIATALWYTSGPLWNGGVLGWRDITGVNLPSCCETLSDAPPATTLTAVALIALGVIALAAGIAAVPRGVFRLAPLVVGASIAALAISIVAPTLHANSAIVNDARDPSSLVCEGTKPQICVWPEQQAANGDHVRELIQAAYATGLDLGLPMRNTVTPLFTRNIASDRATQFTQLYWGLSSDDDHILTNYAQATTQSAGCALTTNTTGGFNSQLAVDYAIARAFGAADSAALPVLEVSAEARLPSTRLSGSDSRAALGIATSTDMRNAISAWEQHVEGCPGS